MDEDQNNVDYLCSVCARDFLTLHEFNEHKRSNDHRINWLEKQYRYNRLNYLKDKNGIRIEGPANTSKITYLPDSYTIELITNNENQALDSNSSSDDDEDDEPLIFSLKIIHDGTLPIYFTGIDILNRVRLLESDTQLILTDHYNLIKRENTIHFLPGNTHDASCMVRPGAIARALHIPILFEFLPIEGSGDKQPFYIGKTIEIKGASYVVRDFGKYIEGVKPESSSSVGVNDDFSEWSRDPLRLTLPLESYHIPPWFQTLAFNNNPITIRKQMGFNESVTSKTHKHFFRTLLWLEELQQELDIQFYSRKGITFRFLKNPTANGIWLVELIEKDLGENRPCVMVKDRVFVCVTDEAAKMDNPQYYEGYVHKVTEISVYIGFHQNMFITYFNEKTKFNLEYVINRYSLQVAHRSLDLCKNQNLYGFLFPHDHNDNRFGNFLPQITCYDQNIMNNTEQIQAIQHIVARSSDEDDSRSPYVIFGPPGTGKTVTVVEAIKQVLFNIDRSYVLACAPSNTAADVLTERLLEHFDQNGQEDKKLVIRLYAESRIKHLENISERLKNSSNYFPRHKAVVFPNKEVLMKRRVVVCTFITAAKLAAAQFPDHHFTHVFLDEVGHAMECEALVAVAGILPPWGHLIMAGDPHQLGPVIRNMQAMAGGHIFSKTGLDTSLLERIMAIPQYKQKNGAYDPNYVTKLVKNYRSHHSILKIPNELFYNSELQARGDPELVNYFCNWCYLPTKGFPIVFHSVQGEDKMEKNSPSYHNPYELRQVMSYLKKLLNGKPHVDPAEIGIITPYRLQVEKLRQAVNRDLPEHLSSVMKIGSVEDFQGEERKVIIISTVRATNRHLSKDNLYKLGFLRNPKRFNVAVTRAQCLLILVGCPRVLMLDSNWKRLILYIQEMGGFTGHPMQIPRQTIEDIIEKTKGLNIRPTVGDVSQRQVVEVPPWNRN